MSSKSFYDQILAATGKGTPNYSLYAVPAMYAITMLPHVLALVLFSGGQIKNTSPRDSVAAVSRKEKKTAADRQMLRAEACQTNGFENIGWFAAAVVAGNVAKLPAEQLNTLSGGYIALRILYTLFYIGVDSEVLSFIRSGIYFSSIGLKITLFVRAAKALQ